MAIYSQKKWLPHKYFPKHRLANLFLGTLIFKSAYRSVEKGVRQFTCRQCLQKPANTKTNNTEIRQNFSRQKFYVIKHYISFWNQNKKALKFNLCIFFASLCSWILASIKRNKLISSIFWFHIDHRHQPSGSYLYSATCMMQTCHLNAMLTYVGKTSNLRAQSDLACCIDVVS